MTNRGRIRKIEKEIRKQSGSDSILCLKNGRTGQYRHNKKYYDSVEELLSKNNLSSETHVRIVEVDPVLLERFDF